MVDPNANEYQCTDTPLSPDDTPETSTWYAPPFAITAKFSLIISSPIDKDQLWSGDWSILIISNNGDGDPIAYERDFTLSVGPQQTATYTPTVTVPFTTTPVVNSTSVETDTSTTTLPKSTITEPSTTLSPTKTITPRRVTVTTTNTLLTITKTIPTIVISKSTTVVTASCSIPPKQWRPDPTCHITPTLIHAAALEPTSRSVKFRIKDRSVLDDKAKFLEERHERLAHLAKRAPDSPTVTVTDQNTSDYITTTSTVTAAASTLTITSTSEVTATLTPSPIVILSGKTTAPVVTVTAPTPTRVITKFAIDTVYKTKTYSTTVVIKSTTTPAATASACKSKGGIIV